MNEPTLVPGLLACVREQLLKLNEITPGDPHTAQIADATDHTAAAITALARVFGADGLPTPDGVTYLPWTNGYAIGYRCCRKTESDYYVYLNPSSDTDDGVPNVFLYIGKRGDPVHDEPIAHAAVPRQAGVELERPESDDA